MLHGQYTVPILKQVLTLEAPWKWKVHATSEVWWLSLPDNIVKIIPFIYDARVHRKLARFGDTVYMCIWSCHHQVSPLCASFGRA